MTPITINRVQKYCALCKYWNGAIGSTSIRIVSGGVQFKLDGNEKHSCFKPGRGMEMTAHQTCPHFNPRYEDWQRGRDMQKCKTCPFKRG